jgi:plasmid stabilization system protein ParE
MDVTIPKNLEARVFFEVDQSRILVVRVLHDRMD